jgi:quinohemoprotein amine dehydrogenase
MSRQVLKVAIVLSLIVLMVGCSSSKTNLELGEALDGRELMMTRCAGCHVLGSDKSFARISEQRKSPEGWFMSIVRMERAGRVVLAEDERRAIVKYLADDYGLAPKETQLYRKDLEKRPNTLDPISDPDLQTMCARCHSSARIALQRRSEDEWRNLVHFHVAQFPTLEYAAGSRDREWWHLALNKVVPDLSRQYGLENDDWSQWQAASKHSLAGQWRVLSYQPGVGLSQGEASIRSLGSDRYEAEYLMVPSKGEAWSAQSEALVYSAFEWRGAREHEGQAIREVFALSEDGLSLEGRWFYQNRDEIGAAWRAVRMTSDSVLMEVYPAYIKAGETKNISLFGVALDGEIELGEGLSYEVLERDDTTVQLRVSAAESLKGGVHALKLDGVKQGQIQVYRQIDRVHVVPENAIARLGGGKVPAVKVQFEALAYSNGPDLVENTDDDELIGVFPASWSQTNFDAIADSLQDTRFAGNVDQQGLFSPGPAGINPERYIPTNNTGVLAITGEVADGPRVVTGQSRLVVTVQRFIDPPIR